MIKIDVGELLLDVLCWVNTLSLALVWLTWYTSHTTVAGYLAVLFLVSGFFIGLLNHAREVE